MGGEIPSMASSNQVVKENCIIVVLGASGDLAKKKTLPALFGLYKIGLLPKNTHIVGYARTKMDDKTFHEKASSYIKNKDDPEVKKKLDRFLSFCTYVPGQYNEDAAFQVLEKHIKELEKSYADKPKSRFFYMALPPSVFIDVARCLRRNNYVDGGINRLIVEKPFGKDLESSRQMMGALKSMWKEEETFRIDHYLGKEMVKNLLVMRFANNFLDAGLNKHLVANVQITFKEPFGTEGRGGYFDEFGIIRDIEQNHLLQVLSLLAMERPVSFSAEDIRDEKVKLLRFIPPVREEDTLLGQYVSNGEKPGYKDDDTVPKDSNCPTFAALTLWVNNPRWEGVPFIMKAGKAMDEGKVEIRVQYKDVTSGIFKDIPRNELVFRIQPSEAVYIKMNGKKPGLEMRTITTDLDLTYKDRFQNAQIPEAYEALLLDAFKGDHSNFVRDDELDVAWKIFTPLLHKIDDGKLKPLPYPYGSRGPEKLDEFIIRYGYKRSSAGYQWPKTSL